MRKFTPNGNHKYYLSGEQILAEEISVGNTVETRFYYYDASGITGMKTVTGTNVKRYFFQKNIQGDVVNIVDGGCNHVATYHYDAWGNHRVSITSGVDNDNHIGRINPFRYRGYYYDSETGLYYVNNRYYAPELGRFIQPTNSSNLNPFIINGLNPYTYTNDNPIGVAYSNSNVGGTISGGTVNYLTMKSSISYNRSNSIDLLVFDPNFLGNLFAHNENVFSTGAGIVEAIRRSNGLGLLESLSKISKVLMHTGFWLNIGLSAHNNFSNEELSNREQWVSFVVDTIHNTGQTVGSFFLGCIPFAGPFLAIAVPIVVDYLWSGELCIFGFDIDVEPITIEGKL